MAQSFYGIKSLSASATLTINETPMFFRDFKKISEICRGLVDSKL